MAKKKKPRPVWVLDCETDPFGWNPDSFEDNEVHPFVWGLRNLADGSYYEFWNDDLNEYGCYSGTRKFIEFIQDEEGLFYAHNGGKFDFMFLLPWFDKDITLVNGRIAKATIGKCEFRDSFMILPVPLSQMEKETDFDYAEKMHFMRRHKYKKEIADYLKSDCVNLGVWVQNFIDQFGIQFTLAGTALKEIKKVGIDVPTTYEHYDSKMRPFYFGGRTQCFEKGEFEGPLDYYDINSAYPFAMLHKHPMSQLHTEFRGKLPAGRNAVFFATIEAISKGCLPVRVENDKLHYPVDDVVREYNATCWEIWAGLDTGTLEIKKVLWGVRFLECGDFSAFINKWYDIKKNSEKGTAEYLFSKLIQNACYGKYGQDARSFKKFCLTPVNKHPMYDVPLPTAETAEEWQAEFDSWKPYGDHYEYSVWEKPDPGFRFYNVATAASITGFVRAYLWRHICASDGVLYCDTDSIICKRFVGVVGDELGQWSHECDVLRAWIAQRKMYCLETSVNPWKSEVKQRKNTTTLTIEYKPEFKTASKGVRLTPEQIIKGVRHGGQLTVQKESPAFSVKFGQRFIEKTIDFNS